jgi:hypothetical protein
MARGKSDKLMTRLPAAYRDNYLSLMDRRTKVCRAVLGRIAELESDAGGEAAITHARRSLIRRAAFIEVLIEGKEIDVATGQEIDAGTLTQLTNTLLGLYRVLGVERKARPVRRLREVMESAA